MLYMNWQVRFNHTLFYAYDTAFRFKKHITLKAQQTIMPQDLFMIVKLWHALLLPQNFMGTEWQIWNMKQYRLQPHNIHLLYEAFNS
jgi:hypothetical protein